MLSGKEHLQEALGEALSLEKGMREFYRYAEVKAASDAARDTFEMLRTWEERHMQYIESLYQALMGDREFQSYESFRERTATGYIESGISLEEAQKLFELKEPVNDMEIVIFALDMEEKAYNFYRRLSQSAEDTNARVVFEEMMAQEQKHLDGLRSLQTSIES